MALPAVKELRTKTLGLSSGVYVALGSKRHAESCAYMEKRETVSQARLYYLYMKHGLCHVLE